MKEFIKEFGKENFTIMLAIVGAIVLILVIMVILEKRSANKLINREINNIENTKNQKQLVSEEILKHNDNVEVLEEPSYEKVEEKEIYYEANNPTKEEAKEKLEEVTKRLIDEEENQTVNRTSFESEQEEKSIISYEELVKSSHDIDQKNDRVLKEEEESAITIEELYRKHAEEQNILEESTRKEEIKVNNPIFEEDKKFKNSEVISPVFGIYSGKVKPQTALKEMDDAVEQKDLEDEIKRTEDFLSELKKLKNKLD